MKTIILHGELGQVCGAKWVLDVKTPAEALRAIEANTGKLYRYLKQKDGGYAEYRILLDDQDWQGVEQLTLPIKTFETIHFVPVIKGANNSQGTWMTIIGILLIIVAVALAIPSGGTSVAAGGTWIGGFFGALTGGAVGLVFTVGAALTLGGISSLLTPVSKFGNDEKPANRPSYLFNGPINTMQQGNPVPILYGELLVGSQVISAGVRSTDLPTLTLWVASIRYAVGSQVQYHHRYYESVSDDDVAPNKNRRPPTFPVETNDWWKDVTDAP